MNFNSTVLFFIAFIAAVFILYGFYDNNRVMCGVASLVFVLSGSAGVYYMNKSTFTDDEKKIKSY